MNVKHCFIVVGLLASAPVAHAKSLPVLDLDDLLFESESVVEGRITTMQARVGTYWPSAYARVEKTWLGTNLTGKTVPLGDLGLYYRGPSQVGAAQINSHRRSGQLYMEQSEKMRPLEKGDRALFFLFRPAVRYKRYVRADNSPPLPWSAAPSGVYMMRSNMISGFVQLNNPGGYNELWGVTPAQFNATFAATWKRVKELKARLGLPPRKHDAAYFQGWARRRQEAMAHNGWVSSWWEEGDNIKQAVGKRLKEIALLSDTSPKLRKPRRST